MFLLSRLMNYKVMKTIQISISSQREVEGSKDTNTTKTKQLRGIASGVRSLFLVGLHGKQTVLIKSPLLVRT